MLLQDIMFAGNVLGIVPHVRDEIPEAGKIE